MAATFQDVYNRVQAEIDWVGASDATLGTLGRFSQGGDRPLVTFDGDANTEILLVAGEDTNEVPPITAIPHILDRVDALDQRPRTHILPFFNKPPILSETVDAAAADYTELKNGLSSSPLTVDADQLQAELPHVNNEFGVDEAFYHPDTGILAVDADQYSYQLVSAAVNLFADAIEDKFYLPMFSADTLEPYYPIPWEEQGVQLSYRPLHNCFDLENTPAPLQDLKPFAEDMDAILNLHCYNPESIEDDGHIYFNYNAPQPVVDELTAYLTDHDIPVPSADALQNSPFRFKGDVSDGALTIDMEQNTHLPGQAQRYGLTSETPLNDDAERISTEAALAFVTYHADTTH